ncbi:MAG: flagellar assembly protein FliH [Ignavibacteria bacterium]|jgi:flagellar assembly protein FliH|nr:flagellar assembly protein FliH [Ignavibacteria bacterium]
MGQIVLKIPKRKKQLQIIQSEKRLTDIIEQRHLRIREQLGWLDGFDIPADAIDKDMDNIEMIMPYIDDDNIDEFDNKLPEATKEEYIAESAAETTKAFANYSDLAILDTLRQEPDIEIELPPDEEPEERKTIFTEVFQVTDKEKPVQVIRNDDRKKTIEVDIAEKYVQEAYDRGYEDCKEIANLNAEGQILESYRYIRRIDKLATELRSHYQRELTEINNKIIDLAVTVAEVIIDREIGERSQTILEQISKAMLELNDDIVFNITINPEDFAILEQAKSSLSTNSKSFASTTITTDASIKKGGCMLATSAGNIDATIDTQIKKIRQELDSITSEEYANTIPFMDNPIPEVDEISDDMMDQMDKIVNDANAVEAKEKAEPEI